MVAHGGLTPEHGISPPPPPFAPHAAPRPAAPRDPRFQTFRSQEDFGAIARTCSLLEECGFYWGPLPVSAAHERLRAEPVGTFLLRDSRQNNCFFAVSVRMASGPTSVRVLFRGGRFSLDGGKEEGFECLFRLLEHYVASPRKVLSRPLRKERVRPLQELCRRSIVAAAGKEGLARLPLNPVLKDYLAAFPFKL
ncbi:suppressor of cytokine signaling 1-like [Anolis sagrei]|uniref:suppressor of cytokine signaling 1-like n=1 Tax=Anolis sagrei TaxID=38937 RepID=UPI0035221FD6